MDLTLTRAQLHGCINAIPSKSRAHRLLICAALASAPSEIVCSHISQDTEATAACLNAMGAKIKWERGVFSVTPIVALPDGEAVLPCRESGSTLRFLLPLCGALGISACFRMEGRLPQRPMDALCDVLRAHGMEIWQEGDLLRCRGQLCSGAYAIAGNVSSQYLTGLLFALPLLCGNSTLRLTTALESRPYLDLTLETLALCGVRVHEEHGTFTVPGNQRPAMPPHITVEGDWSDAAVFLAAGALAGPVTVRGLRMDSAQGDRAILQHLRAFGAAVETGETDVTVSLAELRGITADVSETPDLVPVLAALAACADGDTHIKNAARLRLKESDRLRAVHDLVCALGGSAEEFPDSLIIHGCEALRGGTPDLRGDHRIAMAAALCSLRCTGPVILHGAQCTDKSHPNFWTDFLSLRKEP